MKKHKSKLVVIVAMALIFFGGISVGATIRWQGTDEVFNIKDNLVVLKDRLFSQKEKIENLENELQETISKTDHENILKQLQDRYNNDIAYKDKIIQDYMIIERDLKAEISNLKNELEQAYRDVKSIDKEIEDILRETE